MSSTILFCFTIGLMAAFWLFYLYFLGSDSPKKKKEREHERFMENYWFDVKDQRFQREVRERQKKIREDARRKRAIQSNFVKPRKTEIKIQLAKVIAHCPLCREHLDETKISCEDCKASYHAECLTEMTGDVCSTLGCKKKLEVKKPEIRKRHQSMDLNKLLKNSMRRKNYTWFRATGRRPRQN